MRKKILEILKDNCWYSFEQLLASVVKTTLNDPYLNETSVRMCFSLKNDLQKELQEVYRAGLIEWNYDEFRKIK